MFNCKKNKADITIFFFFTIVLSISSANGVVAESPSSDRLTANEIMKRMVEVYANSKSYSDSGVVQTVFVDSDGKRTVEKPFTTAFVRPDRFRFEYIDKTQARGKRKFIVHLTGQTVQTYWGIDKEFKPESLDRAIAGATGVSGGSAIRVPAMLLPKEITWRRPIRFNNPKRLDDDVLEGIECFRINDIVLGAIPTTIWVDKKTYLLKKVYSEQTFEDFRTQETTIYEPILDGNVTEDMLEFSSPQDRPWWKFW